MSDAIGLVERIYESVCDGSGLASDDRVAFRLVLEVVFGGVSFEEAFGLAPGWQTALHHRQRQSLLTDYSLDDSNRANARKLRAELRHYRDCGQYHRDQCRPDGVEPANPQLYKMLIGWGGEVRSEESLRKLFADLAG